MFDDAEYIDMFKTLIKGQGHLQNKMAAMSSKDISESLKLKQVLCSSQWFKVFYH